ncbi:MAG: hypothetical protein ACI9UU_002155 [Candidatus Azotimanducaceae bacterium]
MSNIDNLDPTQPVKLVPIAIPKPWGQEIWYTGMEVRGESSVQYQGADIPLSRYLNSIPGATNNLPLLLLKVLDPDPTPISGDLYFEVHEEKQEVYIVTHVDSAAWPDGRGAIRIGMDQTLRQDFSDDGKFRTAYLEAVKSYEAIRRAIDEEGDSLSAEESSARAHMESFTEHRTLAVGDVVKVPTWTPHALQHGVRVVEFQTQTYERYIISFAQAVITQDHWDSTHAIAHMNLEPPPKDDFEHIAAGVERIARFEDFNVWRVDGNLQPELTLPDNIPYAVLMALGPTKVGNLRLNAEEACLIPHAALQQTRVRSNTQLLLAAPNL